MPASGGTERRLAVAGAEQFGLTWLPDGTSLAIVDKAANGAPDGIYLLSARDGTKLPLTSPPPGSIGDCLPRFSPDGRLLAFVRVRQLYLADICVMDLRRRALTRVTREEEHVLGAPDWLQSSRSLIYSSAERRLGGIAHLWKATAGGGHRQLLGDGFEPSLSRGQNPVMAYVRILIDWNVWRLPGPRAPDGAQSVRQLPDGPEEKVVDAGQAMQWALTDDGLCYVRGARSDQAFVECVEVASGAVTWSAPLQGPGHLWGSLSVSPDRRWLLMDRRDRHEGDVMVAQNFKETPGHGWGY